MKLNYFLPFKNRFLTAGLILLAASTLLTSCLKDNSDDYVQRPQALISFTHAGASQPSVNIFVDGKSPFNALLYSQFTRYYSADVGSRLITTTVGGTTSSTLASKTITLEENQIYSVFVANMLTTKDSVANILVKDTLTAPTTGKAKVRFAQLSPGIGSYDVYKPGITAPLFTNKKFSSVSSYIEVDPGTVKFSVRDAGSPTDVAVTGDVPVTAGGFYTIILSGQKNAAGDRALKVFATVAQ
ncbi:DUF4397 domain-containing protein [Arcticibacter eurypsychrophilus]|uniref:DUF4397 domain-containing protein n=1 Tax=Arcticibacter eurypsychrophilus TaxID=1434752 RepID=UPI00084DD607|nr:DUF4397 domain-containing protein [Arcticibacter eurypsychrophilus]